MMAKQLRFWIVLGCLLCLPAGAGAVHYLPVDIRTEGQLSVDFGNEMFTLASALFVSNPDLGLTHETASGSFVSEPGQLVTSGDWSWSGPPGEDIAVSGTFEGTIPVFANGEFGLGVGKYFVTGATDDFSDWVGHSIKFTSDCGDFDANFQSVYRNHYVPEPSSGLLLMIGLLLTSAYRSRP